MTTVDWSRPIEAVHEDGRVVPMRLTVGNDLHQRAQIHIVEQAPDRDTVHGWDDDGLPYDGQPSPWRIRNTPAAADMGNPISLELQERMAAFARKWAATPILTLLDGCRVEEEARAIVADPGFPAEVDDAALEAGAIMARFEIAPDDDVIHRAIVAGIHAGRGKQMAGEA